MKMIGKILVGVIQFVVILILLMIGLASVFILGKINQPMELPNAHGMTYQQLIEDRLEGYKKNQEIYHYDTMTGCVMPNLFGLGYGVYLSSWYTYAGMNPDSQAAKSILSFDYEQGFVPKNVTLQDIPTAWWLTFQKLSWFALVDGDSSTVVKACRLSPPTSSSTGY